MMWEQVFLQYFCAIYRKWGLSCEEFVKAHDAVVAACGAYEEHGAPTFETQAEKEAYLATLAELEAHLTDPGNILDATDNADIANLIDNLQTDLG